MAEFDLGAMFKNAFGYDMPEEQFQVPAATGRLETARLGTRYYMTDLYGREFFLPVILEGVLIPFAVVSVTANKTIVSTPMPERGGSVKEMIAIDDYEINIKGLVLNEDGVFPENDIIQLQNLWKENRALIMENALTDIFLQQGADLPSNVVLKRISWPPIAGVEHVRAFEMDLISDTIFDLIAIE
jgi:hypothetical protein